MPRERMRPGDHGRITERTSKGLFYASTYVRDKDGQRRRVERTSSKSAEDARRTLQRHLAIRRPPVAKGEINERTTLATLFEIWIQAKIVEDGIIQQTADQYRAVWKTHGAKQLGALRVTEVSTLSINTYLQGMGATTQSKRLRMVLVGMFSIVVRFDVLDVNPIREAKITKTTRTPTRSVKIDEFVRIRAAVAAYATREGPGPRPGRLLPAFVELLTATGCRPNEVLALRWSDCRLEDDPPTVTIAGTMIDHGRIVGMALHRQDTRKGHAPQHTVTLPQFGVEVLAAMQASRSHQDADSAVFANRDGGWMSLSNMRRALRAALPEDLAWVTPHSFRRTVATVVRNVHGPAFAQQQLSHAKLATTEAHYLERHTHGPDVRAALQDFAGERPADGM